MFIVPSATPRKPSAPPPEFDRDTDMAAITAADTQDSDWYRGQQSDPQGFFALTGQDAWAGLAGFRRQTMDRIDQAAQTLPSPIAQAIYRRLAGDRAEAMLAQAQTHAETQRNQAWDQIDQARMTSAIADGAANWRDQRFYSRDYGTGMEGLAEMASRQGWDETRTQQAQRDYTRDFTRAMVEKAAAEDPQAARALLDRHGHHLADDRDRLSTQIDRHALFLDARKTADAVLSQAGDQPLETLLAQAATPDNPALQIETARMIQAGFRSQQQARQQADTDAVKQAMAQVAAGKTPDQLPPSLRDHPAVIGQWDALWAHALGEDGSTATDRVPDNQYAQMTDRSVMTDAIPDGVQPDGSMRITIAPPRDSDNTPTEGLELKAKNGDGNRLFNPKFGDAKTPPDWKKDTLSAQGDAWTKFNDAVGKLPGISDNERFIYGQLFAAEGGNAIDPNSGASSGITKQTLEDARAANVVPGLAKVKSPSTLNADQRAGIMRWYFDTWMAQAGGHAALDKIDDQLAAGALADTMYRHGNSAGTKLIQQAINQVNGNKALAVDGGMGMETLAAYTNLLSAPESRNQLLHKLADLRDTATEGKESARINHYRPSE